MFDGGEYGEFNGYEKVNGVTMGGGTRGGIVGGNTIGAKGMGVGITENWRCDFWWLNG